MPDNHTHKIISILQKWKWYEENFEKFLKYFRNDIFGDF